MFIRKNALLALPLTGALLCAAPWAHAGKIDNSLTYVSDAEIDNITPYYSSLRESVIVGRHVWDTLLYRDPTTGRYSGQLAKSWNWASPTQLDFQLREDVKFHNGDSFTADDVVFTLNYVTSAEARIITRQQVEWIASAEKLGPYSVRIHLKAPFPAALDYLSSALPMLPGQYFQRVGLQGFAKAPIGTGPYRITEVVPGQSVSMVRNEHYFDGSPQGKPQIGALKFMTIPDQETRVAQLMTGAVDWIWRVPSDQAESLKQMPNLIVKSGETMRVGSLTMDSRGTSDPSSPFKDVRVRQAVNYAVNRESLSKDMVGGGSKPVYAACFRTQVGCNTESVVNYAYNPQKAIELLTAAGYPKGFDTTLYAYRDRDYAEAVIGELRKVGIRARLHMLKATAMQTDYREGKMPLTFQAWASLSINDASAFPSVYFKGGSDDQSRDPQVQQWLTSADTDMDPVARAADYGKALGRISEQAYWAPLFSYSLNYAYTSDLNFQDYPDELPRFYSAHWN